MISLRGIGSTRWDDREGQTTAGSVGMSTIWLRLLVAGAVIIVLCLGALEIVADRARVLQDSTPPVENADEPERSWERN